MAFKGNNLVDNIVDTQKKVLDSVVENTKKFTNGNNNLNETIEKGTDWYKNWLESQKTLFTKATNEAPKVEETIADNTTKAKEFFENWMKTQADWAKQIWDKSQEAAKGFTNGTTTNPFSNWQNSFTNAANPMTAWMNNNQNPMASWMNNNQNPMTEWMNQMQANNWMNQVQNMNPFNADNMKKATDSMSSMFNQYNTMMNSSITELMKGFESGTVHEAYKNMVNSGEGFTKFAEMWAPMFKSMQDKTFNMDEYKKWMNPDTYKEFTDKFFGFMPEGSREQMTKMADAMKANMSKMTQTGMDSYSKMRGMMGNGTEAFGNVYTAYTNFNNMMTEAASPFTKLMTANAQTKTIEEWNDISKRIAEYNIKNAEMQYMMYNQGLKVMDKLAENTAKKMQDGTEVKSMLALYTEWMNISDKTYVSLFESTEYSKLMGEVSSMQNKLRKDIELQMEKLMKDIPVATRSEMDEVYKIIYDLKKKVRQMAQMMTAQADAADADAATEEEDMDTEESDIEAEFETETEEASIPSPAKKATKKAAPAKRGRK